MKRNIVACELIVVCLVATIATIHQGKAKSVPTLTLKIQYNPLNKHDYFNPTFPCVVGNVASVQVKNTTKQTIAITWDEGKTTQIKPGKSVTSLLHAYNQTNEGDPAIIITFMDGKRIVEADITANGLTSRCVSVS